MLRAKSGLFLSQYRTVVKECTHPLKNKNVE